MSGFFARLRAAFETRANDAVGMLEDPRQSLDYSLARLEENRRELLRSLIEVSAARAQMQAQLQKMDTQINRYGEQAEAAVQAGNDDLARRSLERKLEASSRRDELAQHTATLDEHVQTLRHNQAGLERKIALFRYKKEELKSMYDSARAQLRVREALSGVSADLTDVGSTIERIEERILQLRARTEAINNLVAEGVLVDVLETDDVDRQLAALHRSQAVEDELLRLKAGPTPAAEEL